MIETPKLICESVGFINQSKEDVERNREKNGGYLILSTLLQRAERKNQMGRVYPIEVLKREFKSYQRYVDEASAVGELDHPDTSVISLEGGSHSVIRQWEHINEKGEWEWWGDIKLLNTPKGKIAQNYIEDGIKLGISSRGAGTTQYSSVKDADVVQGNFVMIGFDLVSHPSTHNANPSLREAFDLSLNKDAYERYLNNRIESLVSSDWMRRFETQ